MVRLSELGLLPAMISLVVTIIASALIIRWLIREHDKNEGRL